MTRQLIRDDGVIFTWAKNLAAKKNFREYRKEEVNDVEDVHEGAENISSGTTETTREGEGVLPETQIELPYLQPEEHVQTPSAVPKKRGPKAKDKS